PKKRERHPPNRTALRPHQPGRRRQARPPPAPVKLSLPAARRAPAPEGERVEVVRRRIGVIFGVFFLLLLAATARTLSLGVWDSASLREAARNQQLAYATVPAQRGAITDRNGVALAVSEPAQDISADPYLVADRLSAAGRLAPLLGRSRASVL